MTTTTTTADGTLEPWRKAWRKGIAPGLFRRHLEVLAQALRDDDPRLIQGGTVLPIALFGNRLLPCRGGCVMVFSAWAAEGPYNVGEAEGRWALQSQGIDERTGELCGGVPFFKWFDNTPRDEMRRELLPEVERALEAVAP